MESKLKELTRLYSEKIKEDKKYLKDHNIHNLEYYDTKKDDFDIVIAHRRLGLEYMLCILIFDNKKTILHVPFIKADRNLNEEFKDTKKEIEKSSIEEFLSKYYETMKKNLS